MKGGDERKGSMSLCTDCLAVFAAVSKRAAHKIEPIKKVRDAG